VAESPGDFTIPHELFDLLAEWNTQLKSVNAGALLPPLNLKPEKKKTKRGSRRCPAP
jgi:hypothetical protein